jgi:hypothetical protein
MESAKKTKNNLGDRVGGWVGVWTSQVIMPRCGPILHAGICKVFQLSFNSKIGPSVAISIKQAGAELCQAQVKLFRIVSQLCLPSKINL